MLGLVLVHWLAKGCGPCWLGDAAQAVVDILASTKGTKWERALFIAASISQVVDSQSIKKQRERGEAVLDVCCQKTTYTILTDWLTNFTKPVMVMNLLLLYWVSVFCFSSEGAGSSYLRMIRCRLFLSGPRQLRWRSWCSVLLVFTERGFWV